MQTTEPVSPASESDLVLLESYGKTPSEFKGKDLGCMPTRVSSPIRINKGYIHFSD